MIELAFETVTPNFECYEITTDGGQPIRCAGKVFAWKLHEGVNELSVRTLNRFGVRAVESSVKFSFASGAR